jgi:Zn-dependent M16 (insulinase) family peptidase
MSIVKEPKGVDFIVKSEPWTEKELSDFRKLMKKQKSELSKEKRSKIKKNYKKVSSNKPG